MGFGDDWLRFNGVGENVTWGMYNNETPTEADKRAAFRVAALGGAARPDRRPSTGTTNVPSTICSTCWNR